jgi:hypothetical protein
MVILCWEQRIRRSDEEKTLTGRADPNSPPAYYCEISRIASDRLDHFAAGVISPRSVSSTEQESHTAEMQTI